MNIEELMNQIDKLTCQQITMREDFDEVTEKYSRLLTMAVEDIKIAAEAEYMCDVCAHFVKCPTCKHYETLCDTLGYEFGKCPTLVMTPCNGCDYKKGTNFLWRGYVKN